MLKSKGPIDVHSEDRRELLGTDWKLCIHLGSWKLQDKNLESKQLGMEVEEAFGGAKPICTVDLFVNMLG